MKISTNAVGNYVPQINKTTALFQPELTETKEKSAVNNDNQSITSDEKNFFLQMYPANSQEISNYHFYEKSGKMSGVKLGSIFDRRG
ncbi:MAG: hypothetical protein Q8903_02560 [Bacteroidota bacterium]|nr:hypothetical protein [Bacteroidota bacterium]